MPVSKAVIPAAGLGTRTLPASKAVPKVLLPVVDRPIIQYAVEEVARAGISQVLIVVSPGSESVAAHFRPDPQLEKALADAGKDELLAQVGAVSEIASIDYVVQTEALGLGHAVWVAREWVGEDAFAVALPDEIYDPKEDVVGDLIEIFEKRSRSAVAVTEVPREEIQLYGSIEPDGEGEVLEVLSVVEKPSPERAPSNLAVIGRYLLEPEIFDILAETEPGAGGEIQLSDGLDLLAGRGRLAARIYRGRRWDAGKKDTYLEAVVSLAAERDDLGPAFRKFLAGFQSR